jgi:hypothetical protein
MTMKARFVRWTMLFGAVGLLVPIVLLCRYWVFGSMFGELEAKLWPSSVVFMALDAPGTRTSTVVFAYSIAFFSNIIRYAAVGVLTWPFPYAFFRIRDSRAIPKPQ